MADSKGLPTIDPQLAGNQFTLGLSDNQRALKLALEENSVPVHLQFPQRQFGNA